MASEDESSDETIKFSRLKVMDKSEYKPRCGGHPCPDCGYCSDWFYTGSDWDHVRNWKNWTSEDWMRYGQHVVPVKKKDRYGTACTRDCPVVDYYNWKYHSGPEWDRHCGKSHRWCKRTDATCKCDRDLPGYGYDTGGINEGYLHHHGPWCMCRNNITEEYFEEQARRRFPSPQSNDTKSPINIDDVE